MIYTYFCEVHKEFEAEHSMNDKLEFCPHCKEKILVKRLISGGTNFILNGSGWGRDNYSK